MTFGHKVARKIRLRVFYNGNTCGRIGGWLVSDGGCGLCSRHVRAWLSRPAVDNVGFW